MLSMNMVDLQRLLILMSVSLSVVSTTNTTNSTNTTASTSTVTMATSTVSTSTTTTTVPTSTTTTTVPTSTATTTVPTSTTITTIPTTSTNSASKTTTVPTTTSPTITVVARSTSSPTICLHGGELLKGICICPNNFSGQLCEIPNFCNGTTIDNFSFPQAIFGQFSYSNELCPSTATNAGFPQATVQCLSTNASFGMLQKLDCFLTLDTINADLSKATSEARQQLASSTQILTSISDRLSTQNISAAARIASNLLGPSSITEDIKLAAVTTVSQLLKASKDHFLDIKDNSTNMLTNTLEKFSVSSSNAGSLLVQPNLVVQSVKVKPTGNSVVFTAIKGLSDTFSPNKINFSQTDNNKNQPPIDVQMSIRLKGDLPQKDGDIDVGFVLYNNDQFFTSKAFEDPLRSNRKVISGNPGKGVLDSIQLSMNNTYSSTMSLQDFACVFWNYTLNDWSTKGCKKVLFRTAKQSAVLNCSCDHATNFAVLMSFSPEYEYSPALSVISICGCSLSVAGLVITALFQILTRKSRGASPTLLMVSVCICMTIFYLLFIFGINNPVKQDTTHGLPDENKIPPSSFHQEPDRGPCTAATALLQYFLLATFTWSTLYAIHVFFLIKNAISGPPRNFNYLCIAVGWGLPAVIVGISLGVTYRPDTPLNYRQEEFCWLAALDLNKKFDARKPMLWGFLLPLALMLLCNFVILMYFSARTCRTNRALNSSRVTPLWKKMLSSLSLAVVLGLSWIIGYFMLLSHDQIPLTILTYAFCLFNTTQGVQIFVLFTLRTTFFKEKFLLCRKSIPSPDLAMHRKSYQLWSIREDNTPESYRSIDFDLDDQQGMNGTAERKGDPV